MRAYSFMALALAAAGAVLWYSIEGPVQQTAPAQAASKSSPAAPQRKESAIAAFQDRGSLFQYDNAVPAKRVGASTWRAIQVSEAHALRAIADGHMVIQAPNGEPLRLSYDRKVEQSEGNWSWIGHRDGDTRPVVLTFGEKAVFGSIPDGDGLPLQVTTQGGRNWIVETDKVRARLDEPVDEPDFAASASTQLLVGADSTNAADLSAPIETRPGPSVATVAASMSIAAAAPARALATEASTPAAIDATTIDVVLGYTSGFAARWGGASGALTRLDYLVALGNTAYADSQVTGQVRIVSAIQVDYADATSNQSALFQLTGVTCVNSSSGATRLPDTGSTCNKVGTNAALKPLITAREQYGADLVALVRNFNSPENGSCGIAWLNGGAQKPITVDSSEWGFAVVSDSGGTQFPDDTTCREEYLVHELGHSMGLQHDRATAQHATDTNGDGDLLDPEEYGRYPFSFGYNTDATAGNFFTIMSLRHGSQTSFSLFSNPRITSCGGFPCGDATLADNARALGLTMPFVAGFRSATNPLSNTWLRGDFNGDGKADLLWRNRSTGANIIWRSASAQQQLQITPVTDRNWSIVGVGDFNGDLKADLVWRNGSTGQNILWPSATSTQQQKLATLATSWIVAGVGDFDGDGKSDLLWRDEATGQNAIWRSGNAATPIAIASVPQSNWRVVGVGDFNGDNRSDILWRNTTTGQNGIWRSGSSSTQTALTAVVNMAWRVVGVADYNGDGISDILWHSGATGQTTLWPSGNSAQTQVLPTVTDLRWVPVAVGDFDNDGKDDVLWRNFGTGGNVIWRSATSTTQSQLTPVTDPTWAVSG